MKDKLKVPKLRFKEFSGEWEEKSLGELLNYTKGYAFKSENYSSSGIRIVRVSDLGAREVKTNNEKIFINKLDVEESVLKKYEIKKENIIVTTVGSHPDLIDSAVGRGIFINEDGLGLLNQNMLKFENTINNNKFIFSYINTSKYISHIKAIKRGNANQANITVENLLEYKIFITSLPEQQKIADFISKVDEKIEKLTKKKELLEQYKKGLMQKIFSQELRFKDDNGNDFPEWEEKELGELCNITTGKLDANAMVQNGEYRFYTCAKEYYFIDNYAFDTEALLISGNGANVGYIHYYKGKFNAYQRTYVLDGFNHDMIYIKYYLDKNLKNRILSEKKEGNTPYIVLSTLSEMNINLPSLPEQQKIADFLSVLDKKIDIVDKGLGQVQEFKKGLLQQMFV